MSPAVRKVVLPVATFVTFIALWQLASVTFEIPVYLMPAPSDIWGGGQGLGLVLFDHALQTLNTIVLGFFCACCVGIPLGVLVSVNRTISEMFYPLIVFFNAIPIIAIAPILVVIFGTDETTRLIIVTLTCFFPIMVATASGMMDTPSEMLDLARVAGASTMVEILTVRLPHAVSFIFSGLRIGVTVAVIGAVVAEFVNANKGLGYLVTSSTAQFAIPTATACVVMLALISVLLYQAVNWIHRGFFAWSIKTDAGD
ncbi:ABC transporter permease [Pseudooceanicola sp. HF7]|uniref:ABC transporter permease n=1 Tax=Pseudooceanicola sp. HF7 TaxID=2721560 RepID=UPI0014306036|nr:ABC transporter permease [Pseudooceanicola sp. HF7]NIZ08595.1 ABC transporter permease [Pseudooceanicola sp. HF7]